MSVNFAVPSLGAGSFCFCDGDAVSLRTLRRGPSTERWWDMDMIRGMGTASSVEEVTAWGQRTWDLV